MDLIVERGVAVAGLSTIDELTAIGHLIETIDDAAVLTAYWGVAASYYWARGDYVASGQAIERKRANVEAGGSNREIEEFKIEIAGRALSGPVHVDRALAEMEALAHSPTISPVGRATALTRVAILLAMQRKFDQACRTSQRSREVFLELGLVSLMANMELDASWVERMAEAWESELEILARSGDLHRRVGGTGYLRMIASRRAHAMARLGRIAEARSELVGLSEPEAAPDDWPMGKIAAHLALARIHIAEGHLAESMLELDRADGVLVDLGSFVNIRTETLAEIAVIAGLAGDEARRQRAAAEALDLAEAKGNVAMAARARRELTGESSVTDVDGASTLA